ncbi:GlcG/HbpS family heme-binding protein [Parvularcula maris]|uniref:Heme-binding protein n=1 Tax=Parvularcula maris TaxID=2965077 RepID=A0A9X2L9J5_9PROT|nr:heme-binding protein [Parvularcula maris]MCQ8185590.1 heme-binding protein [Parvularcula maris]
MILPAMTAALLLTQQPAMRLSEESAQEILTGCRAFAEENELTIAIAVLDDRLSMLAYRRMDSLREGPAKLAVRKAEYAAEWGSETRRLADAVGEGRLGWAFTSGGPPIEGGVPVYTSEGVLLGGVGVSGASAADDALCAKAGIERAGLKPARPPAD